MDITKDEIIRYYSREDIQKEILYNAFGREVAVRYPNGGFGKRPDTLQFEQDIFDLAEEGASSFHMSEEIWINPNLIRTGMTKKELEEIRVGWDLVLDIDCKILEFSYIVAKHVVKFIKSRGVNSVSCKFSGNHGFHIGVPFETFPKELNNTPIEKLFPEAARKVAEYVWSQIESDISAEILEKYEFDKLIEITGVKFDEITKVNKDGHRVLQPNSFVDIDTVLITSRHLYRSAYSFNEKSGLVSIPINPDKIDDFNVITARPANVRVSKFRFLDRANAFVNEAKKLFVESYDYKPQLNIFEDEKKEKNEWQSKASNEFNDENQEEISIECFPPCIMNIYRGLKDGKKRSMFVLLNFLTSVGWSDEKISAFMQDWNTRNDPPLKETIITTHLRYSKSGKENVLPPNCDNKPYYTELGTCTPDSLCTKIKNPVQYAKFKHKVQKEEQDRLKKEEDKVRKKEDKEKRALARKLKKEKIEKEAEDKKAENQNDQDISEPSNSPSDSEIEAVQS